MSELIEKLKQVQNTIWHSGICTAQFGDKCVCRAEKNKHLLDEAIAQIKALEAENTRLQLELTQRTDDRYKAAWSARWAMEVHAQHCRDCTSDPICSAAAALGKRADELDEAILEGMKQ